MKKKPIKNQIVNKIVTKLSVNNEMSEMIHYKKHCAYGAVNNTITTLVTPSGLICKLSDRVAKRVPVEELRLFHPFKPTAKQDYLERTDLMAMF